VAQERIAALLTEWRPSASATELTTVVAVAVGQKTDAALTQAVGGFGPTVG